MPLTKEQQRQLEELQNEATKPEPRTETGVGGVLHAILDVISGEVPHLAADVWADLHHQVEDSVGDKPADKPAADDEDQADDDGKADDNKASSSSSSSSGKSSAKKS